MATGGAARDISYAGEVRSRGGRAVVRLVENATGRLSLIRRAEGYAEDVARGRSFWEVMAERFGLRLVLTQGRLEDIPPEGPLVVTANHPYGILDGLMLGLILDRRRGDFRILANSVFRRTEDLARVILPVAFDGSAEARRLNLETRARALAVLAAGGAIGVFPGGTVSTAARPFDRPMDPGWRRFTARMVVRSGAAVVPVFFEGHNSRLFQIASHIHFTLRMALLIGEFRARVDTPVRVAIGRPLPATEIAARRGDAGGLMDYLRHATYALSRPPIDPDARGFEFEARHRE